MLHAVGAPDSGGERVSTFLDSGTSRQCSSGSPMLTEMFLMDVRSHWSRPRFVLRRTKLCCVSRIKMSATPRVALPQASSCVPFGFQKINLLAASAQSSMTASWLNPIPRWRSPRRRAQVAGHGSRRAPHVGDDEVVTVSMHFPKSPVVARLCIVAYAAYDRRLVDYLRALTVVSYGTFLDAGLHVSSDSIAPC
jgi:hypothetical protein